MTDHDLSTWLTKAQAAERLQVSTKQIERWTQAGKLEQRLRPQVGTVPVAVFHPDDVAKLAAARRADPAPFVLPAVPDASTGNGNGHGAPLNLHVG